jgi:hypothetical protein
VALANDSITVTPGSGATVATHLAGSKEHQAFVQVGSAGHIYGTQPTWTVASQNSTNVAAARTTHADLFNAAGSGVVLRVCGIYIIPTLTAVAGIGLTWEIIRTSAVGTGGAARTPASYDTGNASLPAQITCRSKPTGGATTAATLLYPNTSSEETNPYAGLASQNNHVARPCIEAQWLVLREGEGLKVDQTFSSSIGSTNVVFVFTVE